jgi:predicted nucleic acid-binding protein
MMAGADGLVIDASVALAWCFEDESTPLTEAVLERLAVEKAVAPALWPLEVANGLRSAERRGRLDEEAIPAATQLLMTLPIHVEEAPELETTLGPVLQLARAVGLTTYDAAYLHLAIRRGLPLATADEQLARAAAAAGVELVDVA